MYVFVGTFKTNASVFQEFRIIGLPTLLLPTDSVLLDVKLNEKQRNNLLFILNESLTRAAGRVSETIQQWNGSKAIYRHDVFQKWHPTFQFARSFLANEQCPNLFEKNSRRQSYGIVLWMHCELISEFHFTYIIFRSNISYPL